VRVAYRGSGALGRSVVVYVTYVSVLLAVAPVDVCSLGHGRVLGHADGLRAPVVRLCRRSFCFRGRSLAVNRRPVLCVCLL